MTRRTLSSHGLLIVGSGRGTFTNQFGIVSDVVGPCALWLFPGVQHGYGPDRGGWQEQWMLFGGISALVYENIGAISRIEPVMPLRHESDTVAALIGALRQRVGLAGVIDRLAASSLATQLLIEVLSLATRRSEGRSIKALHAFSAIAHLSLPLADRARRLGMTESALRTLVYRETGLTPHAFLIEQRISRAKTLLATTSLGIAAIGTAVGFNDPAYFSRIFTRRVGSSPSAFRRQHPGGAV
ncbi:helix-turn-helix domain-containing protein [Rathayibacter sp. KR2-224]|uniref:helix-turn-helix domain-containing protein n=1 Tax=Rathayibacter sp. KR2-224 TaxID=3400913 RepID=UPI003BFF3CF0